LSAVVIAGGERTAAGSGIVARRSCTGCRTPSCTGRTCPTCGGNVGSLPLLGFGLWRVPVTSILLEAVLLVGGVLGSWRAAHRNSGRSPTGRVTPAVVRVALLLSGVVVLVLDALGI
jgi:hypothetical protein